MVAGGGSGHEPVFGGFVGRGLLTASVAGTIFASPSAEQIRTCLASRIPNTAPILVIVMNYTGDVLNFGMGVEKTRSMGRKVEMVVVGDDVSVGRAKSGKVGRRGIAGVVLVVKACGALADLGYGLEDVTRVGRLVAENLVSVACSLGRVHVPGQTEGAAAEELERLPLGTLELGMGIHNEPGCERLETELPGTVKKMLAQMLDPNDNDRAYVQIRSFNDVVLLINNFGGVSNLELGAITTEVWEQLNDDYHLRVVRVFSGVINGSLSGLGFGITLLRLVDTAVNDSSMLDLMDHPTEAPGWPGAIKAETWRTSLQPPDQAEPERETGASMTGNLKGI